MQQVWALPGVVEKYLNAEESNTVRSCFAGLYSLDKKDKPEEVNQEDSSEA